jgi:hypothetical protein
MILETLQHLSEAGFLLREYQYIGMGSIYFVDYVLLHRLLGMRHLLSVEIVASAERRVRFNKPFREIDIRIGEIGDVLPRIDRDRPHFVWLDYDHHLRASDLQDVVAAASVVPPGSLVLATVEVDPPGPTKTPNESRVYYEDVAGDLIPFGLGMEAFAQSSLGHTNALIIANAIQQGITGRPTVRYFPLFSFQYADGSRMLTVGGMIGGDAEGLRIAGCAASQQPYIVQDSSALPFEIRVPRLTRKERMSLDQHMPCEDGWSPPDFDLDPDEVTQYRSIYRYYPIYGELLL